MNGRVVNYYRVSREKQGIDGLGMAAQRKAVADYLLTGGPWTIVGEFEEVESGKRSDRPELAKAIDLCKREGARLVIAKLDRLSRNVRFLTGLEEAGIDFVCCDMPQADQFTIHIIAALAQRERVNTVARTKAALAEIKAKIARGEQHVGKTSGKPVHGLGGPHRLDAATAAKSRQVRSLKANAAAAKVMPLIRRARADGATLATIAGELNQSGLRTSRDKAWTPTAVKRVLDRAG
jgi:DNA invertase Pin-like site-specific DNA recombinase